MPFTIIIYEIFKEWTIKIVMFLFSVALRLKALSASHLNKRQKSDLQEINSLASLSIHCFHLARAPSQANLIIYIIWIYILDAMCCWENKWPIDWRYFWIFSSFQKFWNNFQTTVLDCNKPVGSSSTFLTLHTFLPQQLSPSLWLIVEMLSLWTPDLFIVSYSYFCGVGGWVSFLLLVKLEEMHPSIFFHHHSHVSNVCPVVSLPLPP